MRPEDGLSVGKGERMFQREVHVQGPDKFHLVRKRGRGWGRARRGR